MKCSIITIVSILGLVGASPSSLDKRSKPQGLDVSAWQGNVNWAQVKANGASFAIVKATEGTSYTSPYFTQQYDGSYKQGLIRGAYHFAHPSAQNGAAQADYFIAHGGGWSADGKTLPGMIDLEPNGGSECWGITPSEMVTFIHDFGNRYHSKTGRYPMIYCTTSWWNTCTGHNTGFGADYPLVLARWASTPGAMPAGWSYESFWQFADSGKFPGDQDQWNGDEASLERMALGH